MKKEFIIKNSEAQQRLDKYITKNWPDYSRAYLQKQIKAGAVLVNGQIKKPSYLLKQNDKIEAQILPPPQISLEPDSSIKLNIVYEDKDVIVVDKPAGLTVHPGAGQKSGTLINGLLARYPLLLEVGEDPTRPGIVHRLDKDTSGLIIVAKNNFAFDSLKKEFAARKVIKKYSALVVGRPKQLKGEIRTFISRSKSVPTKQIISAQGKEAVTEYKVITEYKNFTLIEARPRTGRMHQIRVQLAWLGCPVAGDKKYRPRLRQGFGGQEKERIYPEGLKRQFLHAAGLKIKLPSGQIKEFKSPLPPDLKNVLNNLK